MTAAWVVALFRSFVICVASESVTSAAVVGNTEWGFPALPPHCFFIAWLSSFLRFRAVGEYILSESTPWFFVFFVTIES
jgi:hypothetical protein